MASRNRNRQVPVKDDADEERSLWNQLVIDAKRVDMMVAQHNVKWNRMCELKELLETQHGNGDETSAEAEDELMKLSRENLKLCEEITASLGGPLESDASTILGSINILKALRQSSEAETYAPPPPRAAANPKSSRNPKRKYDAASVLSADDRDSVADSPAPGPSPKVAVPASRFKSSSRAGSVPAVRETSVKIEDGAESGLESLPKREMQMFHSPQIRSLRSSTVTMRFIASVVDGSDENSLNFTNVKTRLQSIRNMGTQVDDEGTKARYVPRAEVFYQRKNSGRGAHDKDDMGEGILCTITAVLGEGKSKRYEILDADDGVTSYRAAQSQMVLIPPSNDTLPDLTAKKTVLAMYPGTTTFYRAEVVVAKAKDLTAGNVRLRFEDEDNENTEMDVLRRYVLVDWPGK